MECEAFLLSQTSPSNCSPEPTLLAFPRLFWVVSPTLCLIPFNKDTLYLFSSLTKIRRGEGKERREGEGDRREKGKKIKNKTFLWLTSFFSCGPTSMFSFTREFLKEPSTLHLCFLTFHSSVKHWILAKSLLSRSPTVPDCQIQQVF